MPRIPEDKIEEVREKADIVDVIGKFVTLKRSGKQFKGLCRKYLGAGSLQPHYEEARRICTQ